MSLFFYLLFMFYCMSHRPRQHFWLHCTCLTAVMHNKTLTEQLLEKRKAAEVRAYEYYLCVAAMQFWKGFFVRYECPNDP